MSIRTYLVFRTDLPIRGENRRIKDKEKKEKIFEYTRSINDFLNEIGVNHYFGGSLEILLGILNKNLDLSNNNNQYFLNRPLSRFIDAFIEREGIDELAKYLESLGFKEIKDTYKIEIWIEKENEIKKLVIPSNKEEIIYKAPDEDIYVNIFPEGSITYTVVKGKIYADRAVVPPEKIRIPFVILYKIYRFTDMDKKDLSHLLDYLSKYYNKVDFAQALGYFDEMFIGRLKIEAFNRLKENIDKFYIMNYYNKKYRDTLSKLESLIKLYK